MGVEGKASFTLPPDIPGEKAEEMIVAWIRGVFQQKRKTRSFGKTKLKIEYRDGWPHRVKFVDDTTHRFRLPKDASKN